MPSNPVCEFQSQTELRCTTLEELEPDPKWELKIKNQVFEITNGTNSAVSHGDRWTSVSISDISGIWGGSCVSITLLKSHIFSWLPAGVMRVLMND